MADHTASIVLVDGEHYPPVVARAIARLRSSGEQPVLALYVGGGEKLGQAPIELGVPVEIAADPERALSSAIARLGATRVIDLSDEPVLADMARTRLASVSLWRGAAYVGADFMFTPPARPRLARAPSVAVVGTGKRTGKTAIAGQAARLFADTGLRPVVVAMGRGGPPDPEVIQAGESLNPRRLLEWAQQGRHAASDYIEDALTARVPTVGAWRAGGGMAGATFFSNYGRALARADELQPGILVLEGSGAAIPPAHWDAGVLVVNAGIDPGYLCGYFGLYRLLLADLVVVTMCEESTTRRHIDAVEYCIRKRPLDQPKVVRTVFRPYPLGDVSGKRIWFGTTAPPQAGSVLKEHLEQTHGAEVVSVSHALADRPVLRRDLDRIAGRTAGVDALLVELKAAAVDVVTRFGVDKGIEVVYVDNRAATVGGDGPLEELLLTVAAGAKSRYGFEGRRDED